MGVFNIKKKADTVTPEEKLEQVLIWKPRAQGGATTESIVADVVPRDAVEWTICGIKTKIAVRNASGALAAVLQPAVDQPPDKVVRMLACMPRQQLNADVKDNWQKIATWAPVLIIGICLLIVFIWMSTPSGG